jgi:hypothetical protein
MAASGKHTEESELTKLGKNAAISMLLLMYSME